MATFLAAALALLTCTQDPPRAGMNAADLNRSSAERLTADLLERLSLAGRAEAGASLKGDLVVSNGPILAVARKLGTGLELYSMRSGKPVYRATLERGGGAMEKISL